MIKENKQDLLAKLLGRLLVGSWDVGLQLLNAGCAKCAWGRTFEHRTCKAAKSMRGCNLWKSGVANWSRQIARILTCFAMVFGASTVPQLEHLSNLFSFAFKKKLKVRNVSMFLES